MKISLNVLLFCMTALLIAAMFRSPWPLPGGDDGASRDFRWPAAGQESAGDDEGLQSGQARNEIAEADVAPPRPWELAYELPEKRLPPLTAERVVVCLEVAHDLDANLAARLRELHEQDPERVVSKLEGLRRLRSLAELKTHDPHLYELRLIEHRTDANVLRLAHELREARRRGEVDEVKSLEQQLLSQVRLQVGFHFKAREEYLCELRDYVTDLEKQLEEERKNLDRLVDVRMRELLGTSPSN